uniref:Uncharacterized protein n=1 Tax=Arundo donax TaxID=35708 RepID=A0A0A9HRQ5_ARUDO
MSLHTRSCLWQLGALELTNPNLACSRSFH